MKLCSNFVYCLFVGKFLDGYSKAEDISTVATPDGDDDDFDACGTSTVVTYVCG